MQKLSVLLYTFGPDIVERRAPHRDAHLTLLRELHAAGDCVMGGALGDPPTGAAIVFTTPDAAERFAAVDPYIAAGLVVSHQVEPWTVAVP
ncbi:MAG: uncharacterized protein QOK49_2211 [Baekduia sp.]|jgi:uncharacterized protein YciI|nr:uncharacterized protein [Baekduia sp.]